MRFKVGDTPVIRNDLKVGLTYGSNDVTEEMVDFCGVRVTVSSIVGSETKEYTIEEDGDTWFWTDEMFE